VAKLKSTTAFSRKGAEEKMVLYTVVRNQWDTVNVASVLKKFGVP
jgi:hypothetical protein